MRVVLRHARAAGQSMTCGAASSEQTSRPTNMVAGRCFLCDSDNHPQPGGLNGHGCQPSVRSRLQSDRAAHPKKRESHSQPSLNTGSLRATSKNYLSVRWSSRSSSSSLPRRCRSGLSGRSSSSSSPARSSTSGVIARFLNSLRKLRSTSDSVSKRASTPNRGKNRRSRG